MTLPPITHAISIAPMIADLAGMTVFAATGAMVAAAVFVVLNMTGFSMPVSITAGFIAGFALRGAAIRYNLRLPRHR